MGYTINDIAEKTGLSRSTVSRVLNHANNVKAETQAVVEKAIEEMGYVPNMIARGLRAQTRMVAVVTQDMLNPYYIEALYDIERICRKRGYSLLHLNSDNDEELEEKNIYQLLAMKVQGVILLANILDESNRLVQLCKDNISIVTMEGFVSSIDCVISSPRRGIEAAVNNLYEMGHRRFGLLHGACRSYPIRSREKAFLRELKHYGIQVKREHFFYGDDCLEQLEASHLQGDMPTAIFTLNDNMAIKLYRWCNDKKIEIPKDLSVLGFDNIALSDLLWPPLSTIAQPIGYLAETATKMLIDSIENPLHQGRFPQRIEIDTEFIKRQSIGKVRNETKYKGA